MGHTSQLVRVPCNAESPWFEPLLRRSFRRDLQQVLHTQLLCAIDTWPLETGAQQIRNNNNKPQLVKKGLTHSPLPLLELP